MNTLKIALLAASIILIGAGCAQKSEQTSPAQPTMQTPAEQGSSVDEMKADAITAENGALPGDIVYTLDEVSAHDAPNDCWMAINGKVYDVSGYAVRHPGGATVYEGCGTDATTLFEARPTASNTPHSNKAQEDLGNFEIGMLEQ